MNSTRRQAMLSALGAVGVAALPETLPAADKAAAPGPERTPKDKAWGSGTEGQRTADLGNGTYRNPVMAGDHPDPSILRDGNVYYQVSSSFIYYPGLVIWQSGDLVNWSSVGPALTEPVGSVYAPDIVKHDGRYYIYFAARGLPQMPSATGAARRPMTNYVVHADHIEGPWSDPVDIGIYNAIDPGHAVGEDGKRYLYVSDGVLIPLKDDGLSRSGPDQKAYEGWKYPADWAVEAFALEGPKIIRRNGWFYIFSAEGGTAGPPTSHMVIVARSKSIKGPWENCPHNPIVRTTSIDEPWWSRGHGTPVEDPSGKWWMLYHGYENGYRSLGRQSLLEPMEWTADGWPRALGGDLSRPLRKPAGRKLAANGVAFSGPLDAGSLGARLSFYKPGREYRDRVRFDGGAMVLTAQGKGPADASPLVLNSGDRRYELSMEMELEGQVTAGLLLFYNEKYFCGIASDPNRLRAYMLGEENPFEARVPAIGRRLHFRLVNEDQVGRFYYSADGRTWVLHRSYEVSGYNHNMAGGYLSLRPALFAAGTGTVTLRNMVYSAS
ncbi:MAG TPA: family 43 glycosylhydrolase [Sphingobium sp.]